MQRFLTAMAAVEERMPIAGVYDFTWLVEKARDKSNSERAVFVDVGGGKGQAIKAIHAEFPGLPLTGCVLQDRPEVIEAGAALDDAHMWPIQRMASDFHKEQPVKGTDLCLLLPTSTFHSELPLFSLLFVNINSKR